MDCPHMQDITRTRELDISCRWADSRRGIRGGELRSKGWREKEDQFRADSGNPCRRDRFYVHTAHDFRRSTYRRGSRRYFIARVIARQPSLLFVIMENG